MSKMLSKMNLISVVQQLPKEDIETIQGYVEMIEEENQELKKQLEYLRSGEYYNQLRFENKMLQDIVDNGKVSKEDREFIDCTHRNTELLEQQQGFIKYLEEEKDRLAREVSNIYEDGLGKTRFVKEDIFNEVDRNLQKYKEIIGLSDEKK